MTPEQVRHALAASFTVVKERSAGEEVVILCPVPGCPDKTGNRYVNIKSLVTFCHRCQDPQPRHLKTLYRSAGLEWTDDHIMEPGEVEKLLYAQPEQKPLTPVQELALPRGFQELSRCRQSCYWDFCKRMAEAKRLTIDDLESAGAGFTRDGEWEPYCIFPVYEGQRTVYYQGRTYNDEGFASTKKFPNKHEAPYGANYWIHGLDEVVAQPRVEAVVIVESILNRLSLKRPLAQRGMVPVCIFTHRLSVAQSSKLLRCKHVKEWCFLFDSDSTSLAHQTATNYCMIKTSVAEMPDGINPDGTLRRTNDANDDVEMAIEAIESRSAPRQQSKGRNLILGAPDAQWLGPFGSHL